MVKETAIDYRLTMKEMPIDSRPREKLLEQGAERLSDAELLAIILVSGSRKDTALDLANLLLTDCGGLKGILEQGVEELTRLPGIGQAKACQIKAALELAKRIVAWRKNALPIIKSPLDVSTLVMEEMRFLDREYFKAIFLDTKNHVLAIENISIGSLNASIVHPREVFKSAIRRSSAAVILVHNHPSGDPSPSNEDINVTKRLQEAGDILGISVLDHIIIGDSRFVSIKEKGLI